MSILTSALVTKIMRELKDTGATNYKKEEIWDYINEAVRQVMRKVAATWPDYWLSTGEGYLDTDSIVSATANYDLATDFFVMLMVTTEDSTGAVKIRVPITLERSVDSDANGYLLMNQDIYLYPTPDANVTDGLLMYYLAVPAEVAADGTDVPLSDHFEDAIKEYVVLKAKARQEEKVADFASFFQLISESLQALITGTNVSGDDAGMSIPFRRFI